MENHTSDRGPPRASDHAVGTPRAPVKSAGGGNSAAREARGARRPTRPTPLPENHTAPPRSSAIPTGCVRSGRRWASVVPPIGSTRTRWSLIVEATHSAPSGATARPSGKVKRGVASSRITRGGLSHALDSFAAATASTASAMAAATLRRTATPTATRRRCEDEARQPDSSNDEPREESGRPKTPVYDVPSQRHGHALDCLVHGHDGHRRAVHGGRPAGGCVLVEDDHSRYR